MLGNRQNILDRILQRQWRRYGIPHIKLRGANSPNSPTVASAAGGCESKTGTVQIGALRAGARPRWEAFVQLSFIHLAALSHTAC